MKVVVMLSAISAGFALLAANASAPSASGQSSKALTLRGRVESVRVKEIDRSSALIEIKLKMELVNIGVRPIILLQREPLFPGGALARKPEDFEGGNLLAGDAGWPSNDTSPEWATLRSSLDKPGPPADETRLLVPGESWLLETSVRLVVPTDPSKYTSSRRKESLATIQQLSPVWLRVVCEVWPWNVEPLNSDRSQLKFGHKLQERWKDIGLLWLDEIYSEPIMLDVRTATVRSAP
jgi:hypothetical protein